MNYAQTAILRRMMLSAAMVASSYALLWTFVLHVADRNLNDIRAMVLSNYDLTISQAVSVSGAFNIQSMGYATFYGSALLFAVAAPLLLRSLSRSRLPGRVVASLTAVALVATFAFAGALLPGRMVQAYAEGRGFSIGSPTDGILRVASGLDAWSMGGWVSGELSGWQDKMPVWQEWQFSGGRSSFAKMVEWSQVQMALDYPVPAAIAAAGPFLAIGSLCVTVAALLAFGLAGGGPFGRVRTPR